MILPSLSCNSENRVKELWKWRTACIIKAKKGVEIWFILYEVGTKLTLKYILRFCRLYFFSFSSVNMARPSHYYIWNSVNVVMIQNVLCRWICKLKSFLNRDLSLLSALGSEYLSQPNLKAISVRSSLTTDCEHIMFKS